MSGGGNRVTLSSLASIDEDSDQQVSFELLLPLGELSGRLIDCGYVAVAVGRQPSLAGQCPSPLAPRLPPSFRPAGAAAAVPDPQGGRLWVG